MQSVESEGLPKSIFIFLERTVCYQFGNVPPNIFLYLFKHEK